ncbi:17855_t:CDS:2, partial [Funneliformis geosporum]
MTYLTHAQPIESNEFIPINENNDDNLINQSISNEGVNSDSEENFEEPFGYEALSQDDDDIQENYEVYDSSQQEDNLQPKILQIHTTEQEKIPEDDLAVINSIMKNIKLPESAIP